MTHMTVESIKDTFQMRTVRFARRSMNMGIGPEGFDVLYTEA